MPLQRLLDHNLGQYRAALESFDSNIRFQALFIVISLLLIIRRSDSLNLIGNPIPLSWLHLLVPAVMVYYWLSFGFLLDDLIETRITGVHIINAIERDIGPLVMAPDSFRDVAMSLYHDSGFVDGWFVTFVDTTNHDYTGISQDFSTETAGFLLLVLGTLISLAHASLLAVCAVGCRRYLATRSSRWLSWYYGLPLIPLAFLIVSHIQFAYGGENANTIQVYIAWLTPFFLAGLLWLSIIFDRISFPTSLVCLRRQCAVVRPGPRGLAALQSLEPDAATTPVTHVALVADSLSTGFYVGHEPAMLWRMWRSWRVSWFTGLPFGHTQRRSVIDRLGEKHSIIAYHFGSVSAEVASERPRTIMDRLLNRWHFMHQIDDLVAGELPDLVLLWIGHNNVDWISRAPSFDEQEVRELVGQFRADYERGIEKIIARAEIAQKNVSIIVFGLVNFGAFFAARDKARDIKRKDGSKFPFLDKSLKYFRSMEPEHAPRMVQLAAMYNEALGSMCLNFRSRALPRVSITYSDAFSKTDISNVEAISAIDAWHPSTIGQAMLAQAAFVEVEAALRSRSATDPDKPAADSILALL